MPDETLGRMYPTGESVFLEPLKSMMHPTGQLRMLMDSLNGRIQYEWTDAYGNTEWRDIPLVKVDCLPPKDEDFFMFTGPK